MEKRNDADVNAAHSFKGWAISNNVLLGTTSARSPTYSFYRDNH